MSIWELSDLCTPWSIHVAVTLRIAEHVAAGITHIGDLAQAAHADRDALHRLLRHLVSRGVFEEPQPGQFALNHLARQLIGTQLGFDLDGFGGRMAGAWSSLLTAVRTGRPAYRDVFGRPFWDDLEAHPELTAQFDELMGPAGHGTPDAAVLAADSDWQSVRTVVDVGGGTGALLAEILRTHPHLRGTLVDLPRTVARADAVFAAADVAARAAISGQSFFDPLPAGADLYVLKSVLPDWPDPDALRILSRCAEAARPVHGRVIVYTNAAPGEPATPDLLMLVLVGGRERTIDELTALGAQAALRFTAARRIPSGKHVVEFAA